MDTYKLVREINIEKEYDIIVAGGGPAGCAAAICASRLGAKVLLVEATGCLGGMGTSGLVTAFDPMANGEQMIVGGFMREIVETMYKKGYIPEAINPDRWRKQFHQWTPFNAEGLKLILDELAMDAGVEVRFFTKIIDAEVKNGKSVVEGVIIQNIEGYSYIKAKAFIDATGDAVLADLCGAECREAGRDTSNIMPPTLCALCGGIDWKSVERGDKITPLKQQEMLEKAIEENYFVQKDKHLPGMYIVGESIGYMNAGHIFRMNALNNKSLSEGMMKGRKLVLEYIEFYRKYIPGFEKIEHITTAALMGVRESRRVVGEYELNYNDYIERRKFPDQIAVFNKAIDIHIYDCTENEYQRYYKEFNATGKLDIGEYYGIPYGVLVPKGWENLWVAGRCVSADVKVQGSLRVQPAASMMGQAAGTAAVQSINTNIAASELNTNMLVETLRQQGAFLPQASLSNNMTRI